MEVMSITVIVRIIRIKIMMMKFFKNYLPLL